MVSQIHSEVHGNYKLVFPDNPLRNTVRHGTICTVLTDRMVCTVCALCTTCADRMVEYVQIVRYVST